MLDELTTFLRFTCDVLCCCRDSDAVSTSSTVSLTTILAINGGIVAGFMSFDAVAWVDAKCLRKNDYFYVDALVKAMFGVLDVVSDVLFSRTVTVKYYEGHPVPLFIPILCWATIIVPVLMSLAQMARKSRGTWLREDIARHWMTRYPFVLYILPFFTGSAFVAVAVLNSNALQLGVFSMGLSKSELSKFSVQRMWSIILLEVLLSVYTDILL